MKVTLPTPSELSAAAARIARLVAHPTVPVLGGALLRVTDGHLTITGYDGDTLLRHRLDAEITGDADGDPVLVSAKLLAEVAKALPNHPVTLGPDDHRDLGAQYLQVRCGSAVARLPMMPVEDYPQLPALPQVLGEVPADQLARAAACVAHAAAPREMEQMGLPGVHLRLGPEATLTFYTSNRFALARVDVAFTPTIDTEPNHDQWYRVDLPPLREVAKSAGPGQVRLAADDRVVACLGARAQILLTQRVVTPTTPNMPKVLEKVAGDVALLSRAELAGAASRAAIFHPGAGGVAVDVTADGELTIMVSSIDGTHAETLPVKGYTGPSIRFGANPTYLKAALDALDSEQVALTVPRTPRTPMQLVAVDANGHLRMENRQVMAACKVEDDAAAA